MIFIVDNVFTNAECRTLIDLYKNNIDLAEKFPEIDYGIGNSWPIDLIKLNDNYLSESINKIIEITRKYSGDVVYDWGELKKSDIGHSHPFHYDDVSKDTVLASITYLNNDFTGGNLLFQDDTFITPKPGRTVIFNGKRYKHSVTECAESPRYTIPIWYKIG